MLIYVPIVFLFIWGISMGSFLNVVIMRAARDEHISGRSRCAARGKMLIWRELVPLLSFAYQKGRCRDCGAVLSVQHPLVECATGVAFVLLGNSFFYEWLIRGEIGLFLAVIFLVFGASAAIVVTVADMRYQIIPNGAVLALLIEGAIAVIIRNGITCVSGIACAEFSAQGAGWDGAAAAGSVAFLFALWYFSGGRAMGFGDVKLIGATALMLGFPLSVVGLVFAFWLGGIWGLLLLAVRARGMHSRIAFGPFIVAGGILAYFYGNAFLVASGFWYLL